MAQTTPQTPTDEALEVPNAAPDADGPVDELVEEDLLVEDVSIDGMCGVY